MRRIHGCDVDVVAFGSSPVGVGSARSARWVLGPVTVVLASALAACGSSGGASSADAGGDTGQSGSSNSGGFDAGRDGATDHVPDAKGSQSSSSSGKADARGGDAHESNPDGGHTPDGGHAPDGTASKDAGHDVTTVATDGGGDVMSVGVDASDGSAPLDAYVPTVDASVCPNGMGSIAIVGGTANIGFGATSIDGEPWRLTTFPQDSVDSAPAVIPYGNGFLGLFSNSTTTDIKSTLWSPGPATWSTPSAVPAAGGGPSTELGSPSLALLGANAELVYQGSNMAYYHGIYSGGVWGAADDPVGGGGSQDMGFSPPTAAGAGGVLYAVYDGTDNGLYVDTWTPSSGWAGKAGIMGAGVGGVPPTIIALTGGTADAMIVYVEQTTTFLKSTVHTPSSGWSFPVEVSSTAIAQTSVSLAALPNGGVAMVYEGTNGLPYSATYNAISGWTTPISVYPDSLPLQSPPTVATGVCGVDAIAALAETAGVEIVTLSGDVWSPPVLINGTAQIVYATIATSASTSTVLPDAGTKDGGGDATMMSHGGDAATDASIVSTTFDCPSKSGTIALVGGSSIDAFGATSKKGAAWNIQTLGTQTVGAPPAIVPYSGGFLSLFTSSLSDYIESTVYTSSWSAPAGLTVNGGGLGTEQGSPALSVFGSNLEMDYQGSDNKLYHAEYSAGAWDHASDPVGDTPSNHDYSPSQPALAAAGGLLYTAYDGGDNGLYVDTWDASRGWADEVGIFGAGVGTIPPTLVALTPSADGGNSPDLMLVFEFVDTNLIYSTVHTPTGCDGGVAGCWSPVQQLNATANTFSQVSLAALPDGGVVLVYEGEDSYPYSAVYTASTGSWSAPAAVYAGGGKLLSPPSVATGVCGYAAVAALVESEGVDLVPLSSGAWATPTTVAGLTGVSFASIATQP